MQCFMCKHICYYMCIRFVIYSELSVWLLNCLGCLNYAHSLLLFLTCYFNFQCVENKLSITYYEDIAPNTVHMAWQIPQYFLLTCAEVLFSVTGLEFSYSQVGVLLVLRISVKVKIFHDLFFLSGGSVLLLWSAMSLTAPKRIV